MAILITTADAKKLLSSFKDKIDKGEIETWSYDEDGDFTHTPVQWKNKAWLRPEPKAGNLVLSIIKTKEKNLSSIVYAVYHGRFIEAMLNHCDSMFFDAKATAMPSEQDRV